MGKVTVVGGKVGMEAPASYKANFADNDWSAIIEAVQKNKVPDTWVVGDQKAMTINGTNYAIDIIGKNHDTYTTGGTAPLTFQIHDCYGATGATMNSAASNTTGWTSSAMRTTTLPSILAQMPSKVQTGIKEVNKKTSAGNKSATINTSADKLFLLAEIEIFGTTYNSKSGEGSQYAYYAAGNSKVKNLGSNADNWWTRSPVGGNTKGFCYVNTSGTYSNDNANYTLGVAFAFCF